MEFDPDKFLAETEDFDPDSFLEELENTPSRVESLGRGIVQGVSLGAGEEIGSALLTPVVNAYETAQEYSNKEKLEEAIAKIEKLRQYKSDKEIVPEDFSEVLSAGDEDTYSSLRDTSREADKAAKEENPWTYGTGEFLGGAAPAIASGGATATANVAKSLGTPLLKESMKQAAKVGGAYGLGAGAGYSEADLTEGDVEGFATDTMVGGVTGAGLGAGLPVLGKMAGKTASSIKKGVEELAEKAPTITKPFKFAKEHGMTTKDERLKIFQDDVEKFVKTVKGKFKEIGMSEELASSKAKDLKKTIDLTGDFDEAAKRLYKESEMLTGSAQKKLAAYADDIQTLSIGSQEKAAASMEATLQDDIQRKLDASGRKEIAAAKKAESKAVQYAEQTGDDLEQITQGTKNFEEVSDMPFDTKGGTIDRSKAKMSYKTVDEDGNEIKNVYDKVYTEDVTPFQPSKPKVTIGDDKIIGEYANEATGEIFRKYGKLPPKGLDFSKMNIDELTEYLSVVGKRAFDKSGDDSEMYKELWKIARGGVDELLPQLSKTKADQAKLYQVLDVLGVDKNSVNRTMSHSQKVDVMKKIKTSGDLEKGYVKRNLLDQGSDISKTLEKADLTEDVSKILEGSTSATGEFTQAGLAQRAAGTTSSALGSIYGKAERVVKPVVNNVAKMPDNALRSSANAMVNSKSPAAQQMGRKLEYALSQEDSIKNALIWQLSTQPAFRRLLNDPITGANEDALNYVEQDLGFEDGGVVGKEFDYSNLPAAYRPQNQNPVEEEVPQEDIEAAPQDQFNLGSLERPDTITSHSDDYFKKQTESVDMDVDPEVLDIIQKVGKNLGHDNMMISSGKRNLEKTIDILKQRKKQYGLDNMSPEDQKIIDKLLMRGDSEDNIEYSDRSKVNEVLKEKFPKDSDNLIEKFRQVRNNFGGLQSPHLQGKKVDIPYSFFVDKYGKKKGTEKAQELIRELKKEGLSIIDEKNAGRHGVIDIKAPDSSELKLPEIQSDEFVFPEEDLLDIEKEIDRVNQQQSSGDSIPVDQLDSLLGRLESLGLREDSIAELENEAVNMSGFADGERLKELLRKVSRLG